MAGRQADKEANEALYGIPISGRDPGRCSGDDAFAGQTLDAVDHPMMLPQPKGREG
jgi:hypothetical protein